MMERANSSRLVEKKVLTQRSTGGPGHKVLELPNADPASSVAHHQHRQVGVRQHGLGNTAEHQFFQAAAAV